MNEALSILSLATQQEICAAHIARYSGMLNMALSSSPRAHNVNVPECRRYLDIWKAGAAALTEGLPLPDKCANEMVDALTSGEDELCTPDERARLELFWQTIEEDGST